MIIKMANPNQLSNQNDPEKNVDPSTAFAEYEALWVYITAKSLGTNLDNRPLIEGANDAVRTALRQRKEEGLPIDDIDIEKATVALVARLGRGLDV